MKANAGSINGNRKLLKSSEAFADTNKHINITATATTTRIIIRAKKLLLVNSLDLYSFYYGILFITENLYTILLALSFLFLDALYIHTYRPSPPTPHNTLRVCVWARRFFHHFSLHIISLFTEIIFILIPKQQAPSTPQPNLLPGPQIPPSIPSKDIFIRFTQLNDYSR